MLLSLNTIVHNNNHWSLNKKASILIEQMIFITQALMLTLFFINILKKTQFSKMIKPLLVFSSILYFIIILFVLLKNIEIRPNLILNLFLTILCLFYLRDLMINKPTLILANSSSFWIVMGIFFTSCIGIPLNSLIPFFPKNDTYINLHFQIYSIVNISLIVLYLFIIKSYLCLKHPQNL